MKDLINLFESISITEEYPQKGYLSEISSPARLWIQLEDPQFIKLYEDLNEYYETNQFIKSLELDENSLKIGMQIATFICGRWHRAKVLSNLKNGEICIFAYDYGTKGYVSLKLCRWLPYEFSSLPRKCLKACLADIAPLNNNRIFEIEATEAIIQFCYNRLFRIKIVRHHEADDFYEIIACREDGMILNNHLIATGHARPISENTKFSVFYPSFDLVENHPFYESYNHRYLYRKYGVNFNAFENEYVDPSQPYDAVLPMLRNESKFAAVRKVFEALHSIKI